MTASRGTIAAGDRQTAAAGAEALRAGGTAIDAVCAAAFAAFVVEAPLCSPAGAGVLLCGANEDALRVLDFFAATPGRGAAPTPAFEFFDVQVDFGAARQTFHIGRGSAAVPGALVGLLQAHAAGGRLPLSELLAPAIGYARDGYRISEGIAFIVSLLDPILRRADALAEVFGIGDAPPSGGAVLRNPALAGFLERLGRDPRAALREEFNPCLLAACGDGAGGLLTADDLEHYAPVWRAPLWADLGPMRLATNPPPSSGGGLIAVGVALAQRIDPSRRGWLQRPHALEIAALLSTVSDVRARGYDTRIADPDAASSLLAETLPSATDAHDRRRAERNLGSTTHISVLDRAGRVAALTMSNGEGCGTLLEPLGIHVNNFLGEEDINPGGFHRGVPGTRMTTMMAPTAVFASRQPTLVLGSGGSNRIRSAIVQALVNRLIFGRSLHEAVSAPRLHIEGDALWYEADGWSESALAALAHAWPDAACFERANMFFGGVHAVTPDDAVGDPRRGGAVEVV